MYPPPSDLVHPSTHQPPLCLMQYDAHAIPFIIQSRNIVWYEEPAERELHFSKVYHDNPVHDFFMNRAGGRQTWGVFDNEVRQRRLEVLSSLVPKFVFLSPSGSATASSLDEFNC